MKHYHSITWQVINNDDKCKSFCGIPLSLFNITYELLKEENAFLDTKYLFDKDQLAIFYIKLKANNTFEQIAIMYDICDR